MLAEHAVRAAGRARRGHRAGRCRGLRSATAGPSGRPVRGAVHRRRQPGRAGGVHRGAARRRHLPGWPAQAPAGAGGRGSTRGLRGPAHRLPAAEGRAGRRAVHGRADERGRTAARDHRARRRGRPGRGARAGRGGDRRAARRGRGRAGQRGAAADVTGDGGHLAVPRGQRADPARLPAGGRRRRRGQPQRPGRLRHPDQPAARRGAPGLHPAHRHHPGWPVRAAAVRPDRAGLAGSRHRRGDRRLQRPPPARSRAGRHRDRPRRPAAGLETAPGLAGGRPAGPGPVQPGRHRRGHLGQQRPGLLLPVPAGAAGHHRRRHRPLAGRAQAATPRCQRPAARSSTPLATPPAATPGGGAAPSRSSRC